MVNKKSKVAVSKIRILLRYLKRLIKLRKCSNYVKVVFVPSNHHICFRTWTKTRRKVAVFNNVLPGPVHNFSSRKHKRQEVEYHWNIKIHESRTARWWCVKSCVITDPVHDFLWRCDNEPKRETSVFCIPWTEEDKFNVEILSPRVLISCFRLQRLLFHRNHMQDIWNWRCNTVSMIMNLFVLLWIFIIVSSLSLPHLLYSVCNTWASH